MSNRITHVTLLYMYCTAAIMGYLAMLFLGIIDLINGNLIEGISWLVAVLIVTIMLVLESSLEVFK